MDETKSAFLSEAQESEGNPYDSSFNLKKIKEMEHGWKREKAIMEQKLAQSEIMIKDLENAELTLKQSNMRLLSALSEMDSAAASEANSKLVNPPSSPLNFDQTCSFNALRAENESLRMEMDLIKKEHRLEMNKQKETLKNQLDSLEKSKMMSDLQNEKELNNLRISLQEKERKMSEMEREMSQKKKHLELLESERASYKKHLEQEILLRENEFRKKLQENEKRQREKLVEIEKNHEIEIKKFQACSQNTVRTFFHWLIARKQDTKEILSLIKSQKNFLCCCAHHCPSTDFPSHSGDPSSLSHAPSRDKSVSSFFKMSHQRCSSVSNEYSHRSSSALLLQGVRGSTCQLPLQDSEAGSSSLANSSFQISNHLLSTKKLPLSGTRSFLEGQECYSSVQNEKAYKKKEAESLENEDSCGDLVLCLVDDCDTVERKKAQALQRSLTKGPDPLPISFGNDCNQLIRDNNSKEDFKGCMAQDYTPSPLNRDYGFSDYSSKQQATNGGRRNNEWTKSKENKLNQFSLCQGETRPRLTGNSESHLQKTHLFSNKENLNSSKVVKAKKFERSDENYVAHEFKKKQGNKSKHGKNVTKLVLTNGNGSSTEIQLDSRANASINFTQKSNEKPKPIHKEKKPVKDLGLSGCRCHNQSFSNGQMTTVNTEYSCVYPNPGKQQKESQNHSRQSGYSTNHKQNTRNQNGEDFSSLHELVGMIKKTMHSEQGSFISEPFQKENLNTRKTLNSDHQPNMVNPASLNSTGCFSGQIQGHRARSYSKNPQTGLNSIISIGDVRQSEYMKCSKP